MAAQHQRHRQDGPDTWHHIWNRGVRSTPIFGDDQDCRIFLEKGEEAAEACGLEIAGYCLVGNHYHGVVRSKDGKLSKAMQRWASNYARWFNYRYDLRGPLWEGRFRSRSIKNDGDLLMTSRYVHRNALDIRPTGPPGDYRWSSMGAYLGRKADLQTLSTDTILALAGGPARYLRFVEQPHSSDKKQWPPLRSKPVVRSGLADQIDTVVSIVFCCEISSLRKSAHRQHNLPRLAAVHLSSELADLRPDAIARRYGYATARQLSSARAKFRTHLANDLTLANQVQIARDALLPNQNDAAA